MRYLLYPFRFIFSIYAFLLFVAVLLLLFPIVVAASFLGRIRGGNLMYRLCMLWADLVMPLWGIRHSNLFEAPHDTKSQYVFVFNHISYMDIPVIMKTIRDQHFRVLGKAEMAKIPVFGYLYKRAAVLVERKDPAKRAKSVSTLKAVIRKGISIVIAPEGTFNMTGKPLREFYDGAFRIAIETQTPIKPILFLDTFDRMNYQSVFSVNPGKSRSVFLETVSVEGLTADDIPTLKQKVFEMMESKLIEYKASWISQEFIQKDTASS